MQIKNSVMKTSDFYYRLPEDYIAQIPQEPRDHSRLLVLNRNNGSMNHLKFFDIVDYLNRGDVLVFNESRVIPARLKGCKVDTRGKVEILLLCRVEQGLWQALVRPARRIKSGTRILLSSDGLSSANGITCDVIDEKYGGVRTIRFLDEKYLKNVGGVPLPPYIKTPLKDTERYQTVYAKTSGSVAAPTAGLHFTRELIEKIKDKGVRCVFVTLHVGLDTFLPVRESSPLEHKIHREFGIINPDTAAEMSIAKRKGQRIICVGTTTVRLIEEAAGESMPVSIAPFKGWVKLFILPGYRFKAVDAMITNFHLPRSTLLMMVSAFAGKNLINSCYYEAIRERYRFYSFGDAMLIL
jgi:S-adenosylmethionine:tRNA ribosyltransferase-isomerase